jgi:hypothetical protein
MNEIPNIGGGVIPNGVINNANPIANKQINANGIPQIGINNGPRIIPTIDPPVIRDAQQSLIRSLSPPVFSNPDGSLQYPTLRVPTQSEFDEAVRAEKKAQEDEKAEKSRGLPDTPVIPPIPQVVVPPPAQEVPNVQTPQLKQESQSLKSLFSDQFQSHLKSRLFLLAPLLLLVLLRLLLGNLWWNGW